VALTADTRSAADPDAKITMRRRREQRHSTVCVRLCLRGKGGVLG
jgi:hypothetical protein